MAAWEADADHLGKRPCPACSVPVPHMGRAMHPRGMERSHRQEEQSILWELLTPPSRLGQEPLQGPEPPGPEGRGPCSVPSAYFAKVPVGPGLDRGFLQDSGHHPLVTESHLVADSRRPMVGGKPKPTQTGQPWGAGSPVSCLTPRGRVDSRRFGKPEHTAMRHTTCVELW